MNFDPSNIEEGIYPNLPERVYRMAAGISQTAIKETDLSMAHYHSYVTLPQKKPTKDQITGTLTHALVLQKKQLFAIIPEDAPKKPDKKQLQAKNPSTATVEAIAWWKNFERENPGKEYLDIDEAQNIFNIRDAVMSDPMAGEIIRRATHFEVAAFKRHSSGLLMKGLADCIALDDRDLMTIPDLKTCQLGGASERYFTKAIFDDWGYDRQTAYYLDLFGATFFVFIAVEKEPPYAVACYDLEAEDVAWARRANDAALHRIAECEKTGVWPAYGGGIKTLRAPDWVRRRRV